MIPATHKLLVHITDPHTSEKEPALISAEEVREGVDMALVGGKAAGLGLLLKHHFPVPAFFVVPPGPEPDLESLGEALRGIGGAPWAVRSSAVAEDGSQHSFAGQLQSFLGMDSPQAVLEAIRKCRDSAHSQRVRAYCRSRGTSPGPVAVVVQRLVLGDSSGVMFTRDPDQPETTLISAALGLGEGVVSGAVDCDSFRVDPTGGLDSQVAVKTEKMLLHEGRVIKVAVDPSEGRRPALSPQLVGELARWGRLLEKSLGRPQDIEWTCRGGKLYLLQCRPITTPVPWGRRLLWDNSNIVESYHGVTTPLTYSFARNAYSIVYKLFCRVMGVSRRVIAQNDDAFQRLIGFIQGRVYYNLNGWYRILTLLPGFQYNRAFMEQMMGVSEVAEDQDAEAPASAWQRTLVHLPRLLWLLMSLSWRMLRLGPDIRRFKSDFEHSMSLHGGSDLEALPPEDLLDVYADLERRLLWSWTPPIVNDFFTMIFHGVLRKLCTTWIESGSSQAGDALANSLLAGEGNLESTAPTMDLLRQAMEMRRDPEITALMASPSSDRELHEILLRKPAFRSWMERWMARWGDRCVDELKLETTPLRDRPEFIISTLRNYLRAGPMDPAELGRQERLRRDQAQRSSLAALSGHRRWLFRWVLSRARQCVRERENLRFLRTRVFGMVRDIFRAMGRKMQLAGAIESADDIFYLHIDEVFGWVRGTAVSTEWKALVELRRAEMDRYRREPPPPERFHTFGPVHRANRFLPGRRPLSPQPSRSGELSGTPCFPGRVEAPAAVLDDPSQGARLDGQILVAGRTDPGWVPLYPSVSGLLVERGSALSHSAVVAREMGIPTIVGIRGLTDKVQDGQLISMDGASGTIRLLEPGSSRNRSSESRQGTRASK